MMAQVHNSTSCWTVPLLNMFGNISLSFWHKKYFLCCMLNTRCSRRTMGVVSVTLKTKSRSSLAFFLRFFFFNLHRREVCELQYAAAHHVKSKACRSQGYLPGVPPRQVTTLFLKAQYVFFPSYPNLKNILTFFYVRIKN